MWKWFWGMWRGVLCVLYVLDGRLPTGHAVLFGVPVVCDYVRFLVSVGAC